MGDDRQLKRVRLGVELTSHTPQPEMVVAGAARTCYSAKELALSADELTPELASRIISRVVQRGHLSVLEHASFTFAVEGLSRAASHQLVRHRIASFSQQSQRYVEFTALEYVLPPTIEERTELAQDFARFIGSAQKLYRRLREAGIPREDARFVLPNASATKLIFTMNARELLHVFTLRLCSRAQWEIRELAHRMLELCYQVAPTIFSLAGPGCRRGPCPEGDMSCGKPWVPFWEE